MTFFVCLFALIANLELVADAGPKGAENRNLAAAPHRTARPHCSKGFMKKCTEHLQSGPQTWTSIPWIPSFWQLASVWHTGQQAGGHSSVSAGMQAICLGGFSWELCTSNYHLAWAGQLGLGCCTTVSLTVAQHRGSLLRNGVPLCCTTVRLPVAPETASLLRKRELLCCATGRRNREAFCGAEGPVPMGTSPLEDWSPRGPVTRPLGDPSRK